jgi:DNA-binding NarL/FixJ family response regulator
VTDARQTTTRQTGAMEPAVEPSFTVVIVGDADFIAAVEPQVQASTALLGIGSVGADQAVATSIGRAPDVVVIADPPGPEGPSAAELAGEIGEALAASRILIVRRDGSAASPDEMIDHWVGGVVDHDSGVDLATAVELLACGEAMLDAPLAASVLQRHSDGRSPVALSPTEEEVITRMAGGASAETLADEYAVTPRLVRLHAGGALARLHPVA